MFYNYSNGKLEYREKFYDKKNTKLKPWKVKGFLIEEDSFAIIEDFYFEELYGLRTHRIMDYVQVLDTGQIFLYKHFSVTHLVNYGIGGYVSYQKVEVENYLIKYKEATSFLSLSKWKEKKLKEQLLNFLKGYSDFEARIQADEFWWDNVPELVREFNATEKKP